MLTDYFTTRDLAADLIGIKDYRTVEKRLEADAMLVKSNGTVPLYRIDPVNKRVLSKAKDQKEV